MKTRHIIALAAIVLATASCDDFLDVRPKAEKLERDLFTSTQGFQDAAYGVYATLGNDSLYGKSLTWGVNEILAQNLHSSDQTLEALARYNYTGDANVRAIFSGIWQKAYETIGYANNVLDQIEKWDGGELLFRNTIKGEMLGVRAMLHFDLLRLYAPTRPEAEGIPYVKTYNYEVKPFLTVAQDYENIIADLREAEQLLADDEQELTYPRATDTYHKYRTALETHCNIYAVRALLARVCWTKGDNAEAARYARLVIDSGKFPLVNPEEVKDYLAGTLSPKETLFGVYSARYRQTCQEYLYDYQSFKTITPYSNLEGANYPHPYTEVYAQDQPATAQDFRMQGHFVQKNGYCQFLKTVDYYGIQDHSPASRASLIPGITLLHSSEMYLIAADALLDTDYATAIRLFDEETAHRGLPSYAARGERLTHEVLFNEYRKEMFGEGQTWFNMKRLSRTIQTNSDLADIPGTDKQYVIPVPAEEHEYRN